MATETLDAEVRARVPQDWETAIEKHVEELRESGMRVSRGDVLRMSLREFFKKRHIKFRSRRTGGNGKAEA